MSEEKLVSATDPLAKGLKTSEGKLAAIVVSVAGVFGTVAPIILELASKFPEQKWLSAAAMVVGWGVTLFVSLGYLKSRTVIKGEAIRTDTPPLGGNTGNAQSPNP